MSRLQQIGFYLVACLFAFVSAVRLPAQQPQQAEATEKLLAKRLQEDRCLRHPSLPFVLYANKVDGLKCEGVIILQRNADGKGFEKLSRVEELELSVSFGDGDLLAHGKCWSYMSDGSSGWMADKVIIFDLPKDLNFLHQKTPPPDKDEPALSLTEFDFLMRGVQDSHEESEVDKKLKDAFGLDAVEINRPCKCYSRTLNLVFAAEECTFDKQNGTVSMKQFTVARWDKNSEKVQVAIRTETATLKFNQPLADFTEWGQRTLISIELADGTRMMFGR